MNFACDLSMLWPELPYFDRFEAAAAAGFQAVEVQFPYDEAAKETQRALMRNGLQMLLINAPPPNYAGGTRGFAATVGGEGRFRYDMKRAFRYTAALRAPMLHVLAGAGAGDAARDAMIDNLRWAAKEAPKGLTLLIEPLCPQASPDYFLNNYDLAREILTAVDAPNVALLYNSFHAQMIHGDAMAVIERYQDVIRHVHLGDTPELGPPGTGAVDFTRLLSALEKSGFDGWVGGAYHPGGLTEKTLHWMKQE